MVVFVALAIGNSFGNLARLIPTVIARYKIATIVCNLILLIESIALMS